MAQLTLIVGEEALLTVEALRSCRATAREQGYECLRFYSDELRWDEIALLLASQGMFATKRFVEIHFGDEKKLDKEALRFLDDFRPDPDSWLLFFAPALEKVESSAWFKNHKAKIQYLSQKKLNGRDFQRQLQQRSQHYQLPFTPGALQLLADSCENNLLAADQILRQLTLQPWSRIDEAVLTAHLEDSGQYPIFSLSDALLQGQWRRARALADRLAATLSESERQRLQLTLTALLQKDASLLLALQQVADDGTRQELFRLNNVPNFKQSHYYQALYKHSPAQLKNLIRLAAELDRINKGGQWGDYWLKLNGFLLERCR